MGTFDVRPATRDHLPRIIDIYNYYVANTAVTFDVDPMTAAQSEVWFQEHAISGPYRLLVAVAAAGSCDGYACSSRWRGKAAYNTTVETSIYCDPNVLGRGCGTALYAALFNALIEEDVRMAVAGISLPNDASVALHRRFGFRSIGVFHGVGRKFGRLWDVEWFERPFQPVAGGEEV